jgi:hypothetical protein
MKYATKFMMVPYVKPLDTHPQQTKIQSLDEEMSGILDNKTFDKNTKLQMYQNILSKFTSFDKIPYSKLDTKPKPTEPDHISQTLDELIKMIQKLTEKISLAETKVDETEEHVADDIEHEVKKVESSPRVGPETEEIAPIPYAPLDKKEQTIDQSAMGPLYLDETKNYSPMNQSAMDVSFYTPTVVNQLKSEQDKTPVNRKIEYDDDLPPSGSVSNSQGDPLQHLKSITGRRPTRDRTQISILQVNPSQNSYINNKLS